jgi:hypothetical protein
MLSSTSYSERQLTFSAVSVAMFKAVLRTPKEAAGAKAAAEPTRREAMASFMFNCLVDEIERSVELWERWKARWWV